ncbi:MAG: UvrB/UvrC motif-containing protein [Planctomycetota bacterium]
MNDLQQHVDATVAVSPPLDEEALKTIPAKRGVFALLDGDGRVILVTTAADMRSRLRYRLTATDDDAPRKAADLRDITATVAYRRTHSRFETDWRYLELIRRIEPDRWESLLPKRTAWFVAVDPDAPTPHWTVAAGAPGAGRAFGPFPDRRGAEAYLAALTDAFDLCRCVSILRQAPDGSACAYKHMGRCIAPCDGTATMEAYRAVIDRSIRCVAGDADDQRRRLTDAMKAASADMAFERAAILKTRLDRLGMLDGPKVAHVGDVRAFRFVIIQPGPSFHQASTFVCDGGAIADGPVVEYPPAGGAMGAVLATCDGLADEPDAALAARRMGLVAWYLFSTRRGDGPVLARRDLTPAALAATIEASAESLGLRAPRRRKRDDNAATERP